MDYWVQFAKTGNPNVDGNPNWPNYTSDGDFHLVMDEEIESEFGLRKEACNLLDGILKDRRKQSVLPR